VPFWRRIAARSEGPSLCWSARKIALQIVIIGSGMVFAIMAFPIKVCAVCSEEFELKPGKPGFANRCPACSEEESDAKSRPADVLKTDKGANAARREAMRNLLYRKDS